MNKAHYLLTILWIVYCVIHSFFASVSVKMFIQKFTGSAFKYYRPLYSFFALITLIFMLWFQYSIQSIQVFSGNILTFFTGIIIAVAGSIVMLISIKKYFYQLS